MKLQLDCKTVSRLISQRLDQPVDPTLRARMQLHFVMCRSCRNVDEQLSFLRRAMHSLGTQDAGADPGSEPAPGRPGSGQDPA